VQPAGGAAPAYLTRIAVRLGERVYYVRTADIDWVEAEGNYLRLHTGGGTPQAKSHLIRKPLAALAEELDPAQFARIHRSSLVNIDRIRELRALSDGEYQVLLTDGTKLKLSRTYRANLPGVLNLVAGGACTLRDHNRRDLDAAIARSRVHGGRAAARPCHARGRGATGDDGGDDDGHCRLRPRSSAAAARLVSLTPGRARHARRLGRIRARCTRRPLVAAHRDSPRQRGAPRRGVVRPHW
jgi:hypothetical protein